VPPMPRRLVTALARACGSLAAALPLHVTRVARSNLQLALPELSSAQRRYILRGSFSSLALTVLDLFWMAAGDGRRLRRYVRLDPSMRVVLRPGAMVCLTAHFGNWEILGQILPLQGFPIVSVSATTPSAALDRRITALRSRVGQQVVAQDGAARSLLAALRRGEKIGLLLDQNTRPDEGGTFVSFFGRPVPVSLLPAVLAIRTASPVVVAFGIPEWKSGTYRALARTVADEETVKGLRPEESPLLLEKVMQAYEDQIRRRPECWLWAYKRWKHVPEPHRLDQFPFYAKRYPAR